MQVAEESQRLRAWKWGGGECLIRWIYWLTAFQILSSTTTSRTHTKSERFYQIVCRKWAYAMTFQNSEERKRWLPCCLAIHNRIRKHSALG